MTLDNLQRELAPWSQHNFPNRPAWQPLVGLQEELGELAHAFLKREQRIRVEEDHQAAMVDAVGDIVVFLADFCNATGISLNEAVATTWAEASKRDWVRYPKNGVSE